MVQRSRGAQTVEAKVTADSMQYRGERTEERERDRVILKMARPPRCETLLKSRREFRYRIAKSLSEKRSIKPPECNDDATGVKGGI